MKNKATDTDGVRDLAFNLLNLDVKPTFREPSVASHPFTDTFLVYTISDGKMSNIAEDTAAQKSWRAQVAEQISRAHSLRALLALVTKSYRLAFVYRAQQYLSIKDFSQLLSFAWKTTEAPSTDCNVSIVDQVALFRASDPAILMTESDYNVLQQLPECLTVYRGVSHKNAAYAKALSWTLVPEQADWFAHRFGTGQVYEAEIAKCDVLAYFDTRTEAEIVLDPAKLLNICECNFGR